MTQAYEMYLKQMAALYQRWMTGEHLTPRQHTLLEEYVQEMADDVQTVSVCSSERVQSSAFAYDQ